MQTLASLEAVASIISSNMGPIGFLAQHAVCCRELSVQILQHDPDIGNICVLEFWFSGTLESLTEHNAWLATG